MKIVFLDAETLGKDVSFSQLEGLGNLVCYPYTSPEQIIERVADAQVIIVNKVVLGKSEIDAAPSLKLICVAATGTNNIDVKYADSKGVPVKNVSGYSTESVAQITFSHMLNLVNHSSFFDSLVKSGEYSKSRHFTNTDRSFFELKGKSLGIIGMGTIGQRVAQIAEAFGMKISYYPTSGVPHCKQYPAVTLDELLTKSDIITIHAPLNERTKNLITLDELKLMKTDGYIINMGRGGIINESDLAKALDFDLIAGAAMDVFEKEPVPADHPFLNLKNPEKIIFTPHIAWASREARKVLLQKIADNINDAI